MTIYAVTGYEHRTGVVLMQEFYTDKERATKRLEEWNAKPYNEHHIDYFELEEHELDV